MTKSKTYFWRIAVVLFLAGIMFLQPGLSWGAKSLGVGIASALPPFSFIDEVDGGVRGFCVDLALLLGREMGVGINFIAMDPPELREALRDGRVDLIILAASGENEGVDFSVIETDIGIERRYFVTDTCLTVTCHKDLPGHTVAVVSGSDHLDVDLRRDDISFLEVTSPLEALQRLESGEAEVYIAYSGLTALYLIQKNRFEKIKEVGFPVETLPLSVAVLRNNSDLLKELSLAFGKVLEKRDFDRIYNKWLGKGIHFVVWERYIRLIAMVLGLIGGGVGILVFWSLMLKRKVNKITHDLQMSEKKYRDLIEFSPDMICLISPEGNISLANQIALSKLGYREDELLSLKLQDLVLPEQQGKIDAFVETVFQYGFSQAEFVLNGEKINGISVETIATVVRGTDDSEIVACCVSRDITERRRLEEELIKSERLVTMGQMAAGIAHEINNPLGIILANTQDALQEGLEGVEVQGSLESIERNALRAGKIIDNLLSYTRPTPFSRTSVDLVQVIDESRFILNQQLKKKQIQIKEEVQDSPLIFQGDENQIQQLLINLIINSIEAIHQQGNITIRARLQENGGSKKILLEVEDTGMGIPAEELLRIFDPFFTSRKKKGFGLGLFISKTIVERHNGIILASSRKGQGTVMTVELPV